MYYVPDGTQLAGFYECEDCDSRFLNIRIVPRMVCPYCGAKAGCRFCPHCGSKLG